MNAKAFGVTAHQIRKLFKWIGKDHDLAIQLWKTGYHEARIVAVLIAEPTKLTFALTNKWVKDFDSWSVCDVCCGEFYDKTNFAYTLPLMWARSKSEFIKRGGCVLITELTLHDKKLMMSYSWNYFLC